MYVYTNCDNMTKKKKKREPFWFEEPFDEFRRMQEEFFRNMHKTFRRPELTRSWGPWWLPSLKFPEFKTRFIPIRIGETDRELILRAELPGFSKDEIKLKITPTTVYIAAEKQKKKIEKKEDFFRMERAFSSASRVFSLPEEVKTEGAKAKFEDGLLEIMLPKKEVKKKEGKKIKIE